MHSLITAEYQGVPFTFQNDGWFNATAAAARYGKRPVDWTTQKEAREYMGVLADVFKCEPQSLLKTRKGRHHSGTWMHPKLAVRFAQWLDPRFAVWCDMQIDDIVRGSAIGSGLDDDAISTVKDRTGLYVAAVYSMVRHRLNFGAVYRAINRAAGANHFRNMTKAQVQRAEPVAQRIANGTATPNDWALIESAQARDAPSQGQLSFSPGVNA